VGLVGIHREIGGLSVTDWVTISSLATAGGTLVLAVATYQSVRSANRSARVAERSLLEGVRPVLIPSREGDPTERVRFGDDVFVNVPGHGAAAKVAHDTVYLAVALRNAGTGVGVIHGWRARAQPQGVRPSASLLLGDDSVELDASPIQVRPEVAEFRRQQLDLYVPAGETGYWQGAMRDPHEPGYDEVKAAIQAGAGLWIDLIYGDSQGGQRTILRLGVTAWPDVDGHRTTVLRYWNLDREDPR
jgi:hypothetical protein